jgi:hypothetical protein
MLTCWIDRRAQLVACFTTALLSPCSFSLMSWRKGTNGVEGLRHLINSLHVVHKLNARFGGRYVLASACFVSVRYNFWFFWGLTTFFFPWRNSPSWARTSLLSRLDDRTLSHHTNYESSGRVIGPLQRLLPDITQHSQETDIHTPGGIRTPQSQEANGRRLTP